MQQLIISVEESKYAILLQLLESLDYVSVVEVSPVKKRKSRKSSYDFSDLSGTLEWKGDAVTEQRRLRNEW